MIEVANSRNFFIFSFKFKKLYRYFDCDSIADMDSQNSTQKNKCANYNIYCEEEEEVRAITTVVYLFVNTLRAFFSLVFTYRYWVCTKIQQQQQKRSSEGLICIQFYLGYVCLCFVFISLSSRVSLFQMLERTFTGRIELKLQIEIEVTFIFLKIQKTQNPKTVEELGLYYFNQLNLDYLIQ